VGESPYDRYDRLLVPALALPFVDAVLDGMSGAPEGPVLDLACGTGATSRALAGAARRPVVAVDHDRWAVRLTKTTMGPLPAAAAGVDALPFRSASFASVVTQQGAQFFPSAQSAAGELRRVLQPGGCLVILSWAGASGAPLFDLLDDALKGVGLSMEPPCRACSFDAEAWLAALEANAFAVRDIGPVCRRLQIADTRAFAEHFIEPGKSAGHRQAAEVATAGLQRLVDDGSELVATRIVAVGSGP
jgi:SAM-dependent methyltransferase